MGNKKLCGIIIINAFLRPVQSVEQAERMRSEFFSRGVDARIVSDAFLHVGIDKDGFYNTFSDLDFALYLDKDKYTSGILKKSGIKLYNTHDAVRLCDDKGETYIELCGIAGFKLPRTVFAPLCYNSDDEINEKYVSEIGNFLGFPLIVKESYGSMGKGVHKADDAGQLRMLMERLKTVPHMYQEYIPFNPGKDIRITVIGGKAVAGMMRVNDSDFRSNIALGGKGVAIDIDREYAPFRLCAEEVARRIKLDYCGIDFLIGEKGEPIICEVNSNAFFGEMEKVTGVNVARLYADYIISDCKKSKAENQSD